MQDAIGSYLVSSLGLSIEDRRIPKVQIALIILSVYLGFRSLGSGS